MLEIKKLRPNQLTWEESNPSNYSFKKVDVSQFLSKDVAKVTDKELSKSCCVNWESTTVIELGQKLVTIIGRGRALQISDAKIMRDIIECLAENGYSKMMSCKDYEVGCGGHCCSDLEKFEGIKVDGK